MGGLAKLCKTTRAAYWPNIIGLVFAATLGTVMGVAASLLVNSSDPTAWMIPMGGLALGTAALVLVIAADITACSVMLYNLGIGVKQVRSFLKLSWGKVTGLITLIAFIGMIWAEPLYDSFYIILGISSMSCAPIAMMQLVDYYAFRKSTFRFVMRTITARAPSTISGEALTGLPLEYSLLRLCYTCLSSIRSCACLSQLSCIAEQRP